MAVNRYSKTITLENDKQLGIWSGHDSANFINEVEEGIVPSKIHLFKKGERLDYLAAKYYGDSSYYWIIAYANRIGFVLQVRPGKKLYIPNLSMALERII